MAGHTEADQIDRLVTWWCARGNLNDGRDAWGRRRSMSVKQAGFYGTGPWSGGSLGALFVAEDWQVSMFRSYVS